MALRCLLLFASIGLGQTQLGFLRWDAQAGISFGTCPSLRRDLTTQELTNLLVDKAVDPPKPATFTSFLAASADCRPKGIIGQPLALEVVPPIITHHMSNNHPSRPLVLFFAGPNGVGKTVRRKPPQLIYVLFNPCRLLLSCLSNASKKPSFALASQACCRQQMATSPSAELPIDIEKTPAWQSRRS